MNIHSSTRALRFESTLTAFVFIFFIQTGFGQIAGKVDYSRSFQDSTGRIGISWPAAVEDRWHEENDGRLEILGVKANIQSSDLAQIPVTSFRFDIDRPAYLELLVELHARHAGEELYLWDVDSRRVVMDLMHLPGARVLTPAFDPSKTTLIWRSPNAKERQTQFEIKNVYVGDEPSGLLDIGFGTAFPCHPNAACKTDSLSQLMSGSTVRMRLVMDEGIGWCSGSFVNTTRHDRTPYILSAYHCQFEYTPQYDLWRFDFDYTAPECMNPVTEPVFFSLTGCQRIAGGQASDFLLLKLNEPVPVNADVTFAGWDRDEATVPDTSYLVHHPNADIRKFSTSVNPAVIHPNQIGWTEGFTTPANHHFRFKFTEGGHQPGSSGGPVFNEEGYLVGQLHGGSAGCEENNNAFAGRFAKSWNLGGAPSERLRDWLDPDQTDSIRIPSIPNVETADLVDIHGRILDPLGRPVNHTTINITGSLHQTLTTGEDGAFALSGINRNGSYTITPAKTDHPVNGLNALDLVVIQKHLLAKDTFDFSWQFIASDPTNGGTTTVGDMLMLLKLLLGKIQSFPTSPSWRFDPPAVTLSAMPPGEPVEVEITAIKIGDVNGTADPNQ